MNLLRSVLFLPLFYGWTALMVIGCLPTLLGHWRWALKAQESWAGGVLFLARTILRIRYEPEHVAEVERMLRAAENAKVQQRPILIFPEGTRRPVGAEPAYMPGVAGLYRHLGVPLVPVALNSGLFWPRRTLIKRAGTIVVQILPPIEAGLDRAVLMTRLEQDIEAATADLCSRTSQP